jgi:Fic family protein
MPLFRTPNLDERDQRVIAMIQERHRELRPMVAAPRRWSGLLRRVMLSQAIRGSNTIEGFTVSEDDAFAALDREAPMDADDVAWQAVLGYRDAMTYVLQLAQEKNVQVSADTIKALHYMMQGYDLTKWPGRWRPDEVSVGDDQDAVYEGPEAELVPDLTAELVEEINAEAGSVPAMVRAAMAHLNLVMIHPFKDGNGRMARCLQTLLLACGGTFAAREFASIEEYLGRHQHEYYQVLAEVGAGSWNPGRDAHSWVRFCLIAHYRQTQQVVRNSKLASEIWTLAEDEVHTAGLPERSVQPLAYALADRHALRNSTYRQLTEDLSTVVAGRDLTRMVQAGLLESRGEKRGRVYYPSIGLRKIAAEVATRINQECPVDHDPYQEVGR